jgi:hypothetical protein
MSSQSSVGELQNDVWPSTDQHGPVFACEAGRDERTFPGPWSIDQIPQGYRVFDANRRVLAYVVTGDQGMKNHSGGLTLEEARRIARVISSLPDLITEPPPRPIKRSWWKSVRGSN